ncbi:MAG: tetratricopeptide repeat protein [Phycisphaerales bacterium]|nr:MAG: tetratricopeptide repeat protein [Phycisphaerales bacterium]
MNDSRHHLSALRPRSGVRDLAIVVTALACAALTAPAAGQGETQPGTGRLAPRLTCRTLGGLELDDRALIGRVTVLLFGELHNDRTISAARELEQILASPDHADLRAQAWLIVAREEDPARLAEAVKEAGLSIPVAQDIGRATFARYAVRVLPTAVVVDAKGRIVHERPGFTYEFRQIVEAACNLAAGLISREQFELTIAPREAAPDSAELNRAAALTAMGRRLLELGKDGLAADKFIEAQKTLPGYVPAHVGLARCYLVQGRLADAEQELQEVRARAPDDVDANIGFAAIALARGGNELETAERLLSSLRDVHPRHPEIQFMLGRVFEAQKRFDEAMKCYKQAAQLWRHQSLEPTP